MPEIIAGCEASYLGLFPPEDPEQFEAWRKSLDPDVMGFDGIECGGDAIAEDL